MKRDYKLWLITWCFLGCFKPSVAIADTDRLAALVIRFSQYTELPSVSHTMQLCVLHDEKMVRSLNAVLHSFEQFHPQAKLLTTPQDINGCAFLWSAFPYRPNSEWVAAIKQSPVLWISDHPDLFRRGVLISVYYTPNAMRFSINLSLAQQQQIRFNARLLQLANEII